MTMINCNHCGTGQNVGALFCEECGVPLSESDIEITEQIPSDLLSKVRPSMAASKPAGRSWDGFKSLVFFIGNDNRRESVKVDKRLRIGRIDPRLHHQPDLDLAQDRGVELGVSRMHASIEVSDEGLVLADLGSTNGTRLNNLVLNARRPYLLHDGDEIRFGRLRIQVFFEGDSA